MKKLIVTSTRTYGGKTAIGMGIALNSGRKVGYLKPVGDRPVYEKKKLIDLDVKLFVDWLDIGHELEECCLGFEDEGLTSTIEKQGLAPALCQRMEMVSKDSELAIIETGRNYSFGGSFSLDSGSLAKELDSEIILVAEGDPNLIIDKVLAASRTFKTQGAGLAGVVVNKIKEDEMDDLKSQIKPAFDKEGIKLLGMVPYIPQLDVMTASLVLEKLHAKLVAGSKGIDKKIDSVLVGALSADAAMKMAAFQTQNKMLITGGDRVDLIIVSLTAETSGLVLTNNILPHPRVLAKAEQLDIPVLSVPMDTFTTAKMVEHMVAEIRPEDEEKRALIAEKVKNSIDIDALI